MPTGQAMATHRTGEELETYALGWSGSTDGQKWRIRLGLAGHLWESLKNLELEIKPSVLMQGSREVQTNFFVLISVTLLIVITSCN